MQYYLKIKKGKQATLGEEYTECCLVGHISKPESLTKGLAWTNDKHVREPVIRNDLKYKEHDYIGSERSTALVFLIGSKAAH